MSLSTLTESTRAALSLYVREIAGLRNETAKRERFVALLQELFGPSAVRLHVSGAERIVRIAPGRKRRIDSYHGNAVIEFENSLDRSLRTAERQLQEYCAGVFREEGARALLAIATDGIGWRSYIPRVEDGDRTEITPDRIRLEPVDSITLTDATARVFWLWLTSWLFREQVTVPSADRFQIDFGVHSPIYAEAMSALRGAWNASHGNPHVSLCI